jgi:hypothetical protein
LKEVMLYPMTNWVGAESSVGREGFPTVDAVVGLSFRSETREKLIFRAINKLSEIHKSANRGRAF